MIASTHKTQKTWRVLKTRASCIWLTCCCVLGLWGYAWSRYFLHSVRLLKHIFGVDDIVVYLRPEKAMIMILVISKSVILSIVNIGPVCMHDFILKVWRKIVKKCKPVIFPLKMTWCKRSNMQKRWHHYYHTISCLV